MDLTIITDHENPLLKRREITLRLPYPSKTTPTTNEAKTLIATFLKQPETHITIKTIKPLYGTHEALVTTHIYEKPEDLTTYETIKKKPKKKETTTPQPTTPPKP